MQIFALETDIEKLKGKLFSSDEREIFHVRRHWILFGLRTCWYTLLSAVFLAVSVSVILFDLIDPFVMSSVAFFLWLIVVFAPWMRAFIDWRYDYIILTTEKLVIVDQSTIIRRSITSLSLDSIAQVNSHSQWLNLFGFGMLVIAQKEGSDEKFVLPYFPDADRLVSLIAEQIADFEIRQNTSLPPRA